MENRKFQIRQIQESFVTQTTKIMFVEDSALMLFEAKAEGEKSGIEVIFPPPKFYTDNAAMIASCGNFYLEAGRQDPLTLRADPGLREPLLLEE